MRVDRFEKSPVWSGLDWCQGACSDVRLQLPWPFKPLQSVGQQLFTSLQNQFSPHPTKRFAKVPTSFRVSNSELHAFQARIESLTAKFPLWVQKKGQQRTPKLSPEEQGDAEERALAIALAGRQKATILEFYSPRCTLCRSLMQVVEDIQRREGDWLRIVMADVENKTWLPEVFGWLSHLPFLVIRTSI